MTTQEYKLSGAVNPRGEKPAICVPAFSCTRDNYTYLQHVGIDDTVVLFEAADLDEWEPIRGSPKARRVTIDSPAVYWLTWSDDLQDSTIGTIETARSSVIENRWVIDSIVNPFERLDFAQISGQYEWFAGEARSCELSFSEPERAYWLGETLLLNRARFAVDSILLASAVPTPIRRIVSSHLNVLETTDLLRTIDDLCAKYVDNYIGDAIVPAISGFFSSDVAYRYAASQLFPVGEQKPFLRKPARWYKRITRSDAQRKRTGNQRGGITLVKAGFPVDTQTYFREDFFGDAEWVSGKTRTGKVLETASIRMATSVLGAGLGVLSFSISYAPNRQSDQDNYTSILHLGPLVGMFSSENMTDKWLELERLDDGSYSLSITANEPA